MFRACVRIGSSARLSTTMVRVNLKRIMVWGVMSALAVMSLVTLNDAINAFSTPAHLHVLATEEHETKDYSPTGYSETRHTVSARQLEAKHSDPTLMIDDTAARALQARARVLCWVPSTPKQLGVKVKAVNETWMQRCDGRLFFVEGTNWPSGQRPKDVVSLDVPPGYRNLTAKVVIILQYLYRHYLHDYDWFLKGDDDCYLIMENLRFLLDQYDPRKPVYLGHLFKRYHPQGYMAGGAGYVLSRQALKTMVEQGYQKNKCATKGTFEDVEVGKCLHAAGVASYNSRDIFGRDTFHPLKPSVHIPGPIPLNQLPQDRFTMVAGKQCCSQLTISFHKVEPDLMRVMDYLLYRTSVYGRVLDLPALEGLFKPGEVPPLHKN